MGHEINLIAKWLLDLFLQKSLKGAKAFKQFVLRLISL